MSGRISVKVKNLFATFVKNNEGVAFPSLKAFVRNLKKNGTDDERSAATQWFANKGGLQERSAKKERLKLKGGRIALEKAATKSARTKRSAPKAKKPTE